MSTFILKVTWYSLYVLLGLHGNFSIWLTVFQYFYIFFAWCIRLLNMLVRIHAQLTIH